VDLKESIDSDRALSLERAPPRKVGLQIDQRQSRTSDRETQRRELDRING